MFKHIDLVHALGERMTNKAVERMNRFAHLPSHRLDEIATKIALHEDWGERYKVLRTYLSVHIAWSIEQGRYTQSKNQFYVTAGSLQTRYGTPIYLVFEEARKPYTQPFYLVHASSDDIAAPELPIPPEIPSPAALPVGAEVVMRQSHMLGHNADRVPYLDKTPPVAQMCAIAGAIQWGLNRKLQIPYYYFGRMNFIVPLYLQSREDITQAPDLVAPIQVNPDSLLVRTVLLPHMPYANARVAVRRHDQLPHWMIAAWHAVCASPEQQELAEPLQAGGS